MLAVLLRPNRLEGNLREFGNSELTVLASLKSTWGAITDRVASQRTNQEKSAVISSYGSGRRRYL